MTDPVVRPATVEDAAEIARVHIASWRETYARLVEPGELDDLSWERRTERWRAILTGGAVRGWVALVDGVVIGFASTSVSTADDRPRDLVLEALYVLAEHHGTGVGQRLLEASIGDAPASLFVADDNPRATRFYERNGFVLEDVFEEYPLVRTPVRSRRMVR